MQLNHGFNLWTRIRNTKSLSMALMKRIYNTVQCKYCTKKVPFGVMNPAHAWKNCKSFPRWLYASWWYPYKRWRLNKAAWYGHSTLIRTIGMVLIWIHQPTDQDYRSRPDHPKIVKTPPAISRYDGGHASLLIWGMIEQSTSINTLCQNAIQEKLWWCWQCYKEHQTIGFFSR